MRRLEDEARKAEARRQAEQNQQAAPTGEAPSDATFTLDDVVAVGVYLVRPSPGLIPSQAPGETEALVNV